jgi:pimeloyl-ACP methyl ester carboxylesterase
LSGELQRAITGSRLETIAGAGHLANAEKPEEFNSAVDRFLADVDPTN